AHVLLLLVAPHRSGQPRAHAGLLGRRSLAHACLAFSAKMVRTRAIARRVLDNSLVFVSCCVDCCIRRPKCAFSSAASSSFSSGSFFARNCFTSMLTPAVSTQ